MPPCPLRSMQELARSRGGVRQRGSRCSKSYLPVEDIATSMLTEVGSVAVLVTDANKAAEWYRQKLGAEVAVQGHWGAPQIPPPHLVIPLSRKKYAWEDERAAGPTGVFFKN